VDVEEYDVYQLTPIPVATQVHIIATETETQYLAISDHRDRHFALTEEELNQCTKMSKGPKLCNIKQTTLGPAHEQFQYALAAIQAEQKPICKPEQINTTSIWYPLDAPNCWIFATTQEITLTNVCGEERGKIQVHNNGIMTMNADCIARIPIITLPSVKVDNREKPVTNFTHSFKRRTQESHQDTTIHSSTTGNINHLQGEVHQLHDQLEKGDLETTSNTQANYVKPISIAAGLVILLLLAAIQLTQLIRKGKNTRMFHQENVAQQSVTSPIPISRVKTLSTTK